MCRGDGEDDDEDAFGDLDRDEQSLRNRSCLPVFLSTSDSSYSSSSHLALWGVSTGDSPVPTITRLKSNYTLCHRSDGRLPHTLVNSVSMSLIILQELTEKNLRGFLLLISFFAQV